MELLGKITNQNSNVCLHGPSGLDITWLKKCEFGARHYFSIIIFAVHYSGAEIKTL